MPRETLIRRVSRLMENNLKIFHDCYPYSLFKERYQLENQELNFAPAN
jgi:hypothetical protein